MRQIRLILIGLLASLVFIGCSSGVPSNRKGADLAAASGCLACHATGESSTVGPTWAGLYGSQVTLDDGTTLIADEAYLEESIRDPNAKIVAGYPPYSMPAVDLTAKEVQSLLAYIESLK
jgi:cytochrome c oxidase subunit 2